MFKLFGWPKKVTPNSQKLRSVNHVSSVLRWVGMYWRDYTVGTNIAIGHYYSFQTITASSAPKMGGVRNRCQRWRDL